MKQNLWAFRFPPDPSWYSEAMADLFVLMFLEPQTLAHCPNSRLSGYGQADVRQLRLAGPAAGALSSGLANAHYHMLVFGEPNKALPQVSADFLAQWPDHFFNRLGAAGAVPENLNLLYAVRELDGLIAYPLYNTGYVKGPLIIATLASRYFKTGGASWPELVGLSNDLRKIYAQGASRQADDLMLQLGVDVGDDDQLITGFERYFGLN
ncbi:MAG: hypothetical protein HY074_12395 [Deltaproteobacteria bacterium]|nr:hypothetical protein [Deltaproteobacteria bacterium]